MFSISNALGTIACAAALCISPVAAGWAVEFPEGVVRIIVPYPPGGGVDGLARPLAEELSERWGHPVVVENMPGAATIIAARHVATEPADAHTLFLTTDSTITSNPHLRDDLPYDPLEDFTPITQLIHLIQTVVAHPSVEADTLHELIALAEEQPGALNYASFGPGSQPHLLYESLKAETGIDIAHIQYDGIAPAVTATLSGETDLTLAGIVALEHVRDGRLKILATASSEHHPLAPDTPTVTEEGFPEIDPQSWFGLFMRSGAPEEVVEMINRDVIEILDDPAFYETHIAQRGYVGVGNSVDEFRQFIQEDYEYKKRLIETAGARME